MCLLLEFDRSKNKVNGKIMIDFFSVIKCLETMIQVPFAQMELSYFTCFQIFLLHDDGKLPISHHRSSIWNFMRASKKNGNIQDKNRLAQSGVKKLPDYRLSFKPISHFENTTRFTT